MSTKLDRICAWILASGERCNKPVEYKMVWDGGEVDSSKVRKYFPFCPEHQTRYELNESFDSEE